MHILGISGSLRAASSNTAVLQNVARAMCAPAEMHLFGELGSLPAFNPDIDEAAPASVTSFRAMVAAANAVAISTPEYAHGVPGVLKNALDWLVGSGELFRKPMVLLHVSDRGEFAQASLREILTIMGGRIVLNTIVARKPADSSDATRALDIEAAVDAMIRAIDKQSRAVE